MLHRRRPFPILNLNRLSLNITPLKLAFFLTDNFELISAKLRVLADSLGLLFAVNREEEGLGEILSFERT